MSVSASEFQSVDSPDPHPVTGLASQRIGLLPVLGLLVSVLLAAGLCYRAVCVNAFLSDDYLHVSWLRDAVQNPELLLRNFHSAWLDGFAAKFYRPLISVFMYTDYKLWGVDARGFHLTNILFHLAASAFLFGIGSELNKHLRCVTTDVEIGWNAFVANYGFALCGSALFALYPLHPEAVSWITGRVDCVVTAFFLSSLWCYMRWQVSGRVWIKYVSLALFALALMSKEMAVVLPPTITCLELFLGNGGPGKRFKNIAPYWLGLIAYFMVRRLALGTFVGGYDDSLALANLSLILQNWQHGLYKIVVPVNTELIGGHNFFFQLWQKSWLPLCICAVAAALTNKRRAGLFVFLFCWFVVSLIPIYKIFWISENLEGSRLAYLATAPLCLIFAFGIFSWRVERPGLNAFVVGLQSLAAVLLCCSCGYLLTNNNKAWAHAGQQMQAIQGGLKEIYDTIPGDPDVVLLGLPDSYSGAYIARNAISGITRKPLMDRDIANAVVLDRFEPIYPFGARKNYLAAHRNDVHVFRWDENKSRFVESPIPPADADVFNRISYGNSKRSLKGCLQPIGQSGVQSHWQPDGSLSLIGEAGVKPQVVFSGVNFDPFVIDYINVDINTEFAGASVDGIDVLYATDFSPFFRSDKRIHAVFEPRSKHFFIGVHAYPEWCFAKQPVSLAMIFPAGWKGKISGISTVPVERVTAKIAVPAVPGVASQGIVHIGGRSPNSQLVVDGTGMPACSGLDLELSRCNVSFEEQNCSLRSKNAWRTVSLPARSTYQLEPQKFPATGVYQARVWAKDAQGTNIGLASDHVMIVVDAPVK